MFVLVIKYEKSIEEVDAVLAEHRAYLQEKYESGHMIASGSQVPRTGGLIICNAASRAEVDEIIANDPFYKKGIASYNVIEFNPVLNSKPKALLLQARATKAMNKGFRLKRKATDKCASTHHRSLCYSILGKSFSASNHLTITSSSLAFAATYSALSSRYS